MTKYKDLKEIYEFLPQLKEMYYNAALDKVMIKEILRVINSWVFVFNSMQKLNDSSIWEKE